MSAYPTAWALVFVAGAGLTVCVYWILRPLARIRSLLTGIFAVWMLLPWRFDDDPTHLAPAFIVLVFRGIFERDAEVAPVLLALVAATAVVVAAFLLGVVLRSWLVGRKRGREQDGSVTS